MLYEIRFGTDGIGLPFGNVFADDIDEARERAAEKLRAESYYVQADEGMFTVHGHEKWTIFKLSAGLYAQRIDDVRENRSELTSAGTAPERSDVGTGLTGGRKSILFHLTEDEAAALVAKVGTEIHERTERLARDVRLYVGDEARPLSAQLPIQHIGRAVRQPVRDYANPSQEMIDSIGRGAPADDAPEFGRPYRLDEFDADGHARRVIDAMRGNVPIAPDDLNEALRDEIPYEGDGFDPLSDR